MSKRYFGVSTGETGEYGVGEIVEGKKEDVEINDPMDETKWEKTIHGVPVFNILVVEDGGIEWADVRDF